jgi:hypothetical protein
VVVTEVVVVVVTALDKSLDVVAAEVMDTWFVIAKLLW